MTNFTHESTFVFGNRSNSKDIVERVSKSCYFLCLIYLLGWTQLYLLKKYPVSAHSFFLRPKLNFFLFGNCFDKKKLSRNFPFQRHLWKSIKNLKTKIVNYSCQWNKNNWINSTKRKYGFGLKLPKIEFIANQKLSKVNIVYSFLLGLNITKNGSGFISKIVWFFQNHIEISFLPHFKLVHQVRLWNDGFYTIVFVLKIKF